MPLSAGHLRAFRTFLEAHRRLIDELEKRLTARGLPLSHYDVLVHLSEAEDQRLRMQELAGNVLLSKSGITRLVERLEANGMVVRETCLKDGRGVNAVLTPDGWAALRAAVPGHGDDITDLFGSQMDDDEAAILADVLSRVRDRSMQEHEDPTTTSKPGASV